MEADAELRREENDLYLGVHWAAEKVDVCECGHAAVMHVGLDSVRLTHCRRVGCDCKQWSEVNDGEDENAG